MLCCAGADAVVELEAELTVLLADLEELAAAVDEADWLEEPLEAWDTRVDERESGVVGIMIPGIVVAMLNSAVGWIAGRFVCVGMWREL